MLISSVLCAPATFAQVKTDGKVVGPAKPDKIIFAVINDGTTIEPIAFMESGMLINTPGGDSEGDILKNFVDMYYKPKTSYDLIFGGMSAGKINVTSGNAPSDCAKNLGTVTVQSSKTKLKGFVMGLATNTPPKTPGSGVRRPPTAAEKLEIEKLVRAEFTKHKVSAAAQKTLRFHNLTAIDTDKNGKVEIVGSYYANTSATERALLFFIADTNAQGKWSLGQSSYNRYAKKDVMSQDIKDVDAGIYHELFLDTLDVDGDGKSEVFTMTQSFEANGFTVYKNNAGKWVKTLETSNYHCGY